MHAKLIEALLAKNIINTTIPFEITKELLLEVSKVYIQLSNTSGTFSSRGDLRYNIKLLCLSLIKFKQENKLPIKEGFVYFISNPAWPNSFKVGMSIEPKKRLASYQTYSPNRDYMLHHWSFWFDKRKGEKFVHDLYDSNRDHEWIFIGNKRLPKIFTRINKESGIEDLLDYMLKEYIPIV